jgi:hypothetical protein
VSAALGDHECHVAEELSTLRAEVRDLQKDHGDSRELLRDRDKSLDRALAEFRSYMEAYTRRNDQVMLGLQASVDTLANKVETVSRTVGFLEREILG